MIEAGMLRIPSLLRLFITAWLVSTAFIQAPLRFSPAPERSSPDPLVAEMLAQVQPEAIRAYAGSLSGEWPAFVDDASYTITTRATNSGLPVQKATQYVYEHLQALGLSPEFQDWSSAIYTGRNVVGTIPGTTHPDQIVLLVAHLDDAPWSGLAPGLDDNASGSVGVLLAADILSSYRFERTLRLVFFTGEEQGLLGSHAYAAAARALNENIVAVCNLDMIAWDNLDGPVLRLHTSGSAADLGIAGAFTSVVSTYNLNLTPVVQVDGASNSDHASFWVQGYPAVLATEDDRDDFNRHYHSSSDRLKYINLAYFGDFVRAAVGAAADLALPLGPAVGTYRSRLGPPAVMQSGDPAGTVTYSLQLTNTGSLADTYSLAIANAAWITAFPAEVGPLAAGSSTQVDITVSIPPEAAGGAADVAFLAVFSAGSSALVDAAELTTVVNWKIVYLPQIHH
jgi:hypothetical protein